MTNSQRQIDSMGSWEDVKCRGGYLELNEASAIIKPLLDSLPKDCHGYSIGPVGFDEIIRKIAVGIVEYGAERERRGHKKGCHLLGRLAAGDVGIADFEFYRDSAQRTN